MAHYLLLFIITLLTMHLTPGPSMLYCINTAINYGRTSAIAGAIGLEIGTLFYVLIAGTGLSALILASPVFYIGLKICGAIYLFYMAYSALPSGKIIITPDKINYKSSKLFAGILINITNPSILLFFITLLPQFVPVEYRSSKIFFLLGFAFNVSSFILSLVIIFFSHYMKYNLMSSAKFAKIFKYIPSLMFFLIATISLITVC